MSKHLSDDNVDDVSDFETQDSTLTSKDNIRKVAQKPIVKVVSVRKKSFFERMRTSRFWLIQGLYHFLRSIWIIAMAIGSFIIWLIAMLFI